MEFFLVMISVPLFLMILLLFALFVLPHYPRREPAHSAPPAESAPSGARSFPPAETTPDTSRSLTTIVGWGLTLLMYAAFAVAMVSKLKLSKEK